MALDSAQMLAAYGDQKFSRVVDLATRLTRRLNLDAFPNRIRRATAVAVLKKTVGFSGFWKDSIANTCT